jgi:hypothetical protein
VSGDDPAYLSQNFQIFDRFVNPDHPSKQDLFGKDLALGVELG